MSGFNNFLEKFKGEFIISSLPEKSNGIVEEKSLTTEKVTTSEEVDKGTKIWIILKR